jgi:general secretion pathway protein D
VSLAFDGSAIIVTQSARNLERIRNILKRYTTTSGRWRSRRSSWKCRKGALEELGCELECGDQGDSQQGARVPRRSTSRATGASPAAFSSTTAPTSRGSIVRPESDSPWMTEGGVAFAPELDIPIINHAPQIPGTALPGGGRERAGQPITGVIGEFDINAIVRALGAARQGTDLLSAPQGDGALRQSGDDDGRAGVALSRSASGRRRARSARATPSGGGSAGVAITAGTPEEFATRNVGVELQGHADGRGGRPQHQPRAESRR